MNVSLTTHDLDPLKGRLMALAPSVKSSHRVEAMARGLGFGSHAALRTALDQGQVRCAVDDDAFGGFLAGRGGEDLPYGVLTSAVSAVKFGDFQTAVAAVLAREPELSANGYRTYDHRRTPQENADSFATSRAAMLQPRYLAQFARAVAYLETREKSKSVNRRSTSYSYKHDAEQHHRALDTDSDPYVANGMFLAAALHLGFIVKRDGHSPNGFVNIAAPRVRRSRGGLAGTLRGPSKRVAWRNMMVAAINAGLEQGLLGLTPGDNRWVGDRAIYRFDFGGLPAIAAVSDAGYGEVAVNVAVNPTARADDSISSFNAGFTAGDAFASGWLEREKGAWLQTTSSPTGSIRTTLLERIVATAPKPRGYADAGRFMM